MQVPPGDCLTAYADVLLYSSCIVWQRLALQTTPVKFSTFCVQKRPVDDMRTVLHIYTLKSETFALYSGRPVTASDEQSCFEAFSLDWSDI